MGFQWDRVRFHIKRLRVWDVLDKERVLMLLRRELAKKQRGRSKGSESDEPVTEGYGDVSHLTLVHGSRTRGYPR